MNNDKKNNLGHEALILIGCHITVKTSNRHK